MQLAIIDLNRTLYDPDTDSLTPGTVAALDALTRAGYALVLVSRREAGREELLTRFDLTDRFAETFFVGEKSPSLFREIMAKYGAKPDTTLVIGDHPQEEIAYGNDVGAKTVRLMRGKFATMELLNEHDKPWRSIHKLSEIEAIVSV